MKTTTVNIHKGETVKGVWYNSDTVVVPLDVAEELVKRGCATIIDPDYKPAPTTAAKEN